MRAIPSPLSRGVAIPVTSSLQGVKKLSPPFPYLCYLRTRGWGGTLYVQLPRCTVHAPHSWLVHIFCRQKQCRPNIWWMCSGRKPLHQKCILWHNPEPSCTYVKVGTIISVFRVSIHTLSTKWLKRRLSGNIVADLSGKWGCDVKQYHYDEWLESYPRGRLRHDRQWIELQSHMSEGCCLASIHITNSPSVVPLYACGRTNSHKEEPFSFARSAQRLSTGVGWS